jgi:hypothetical protein
MRGGEHQHVHHARLSVANCLKERPYAPSLRMAALVHWHGDLHEHADLVAAPMFGQTRQSSIQTPPRLHG